MKSRKGAYPVIISPDSGGYVVNIPDFGIGTQGDSLCEAIEMARDAIGLMGIDMEDDNEAIPEPGTTGYEIRNNDILTYVDVDFTEYRKKVDNRAVRKNVTIPYWMSVAADKADINYSRILQEALVNILDLRHNAVN